MCVSESTSLGQFFIVFWIVGLVVDGSSRSWGVDLFPKEIKRNLETLNVYDDTPGPRFKDRVSTSKKHYTSCFFD